MCFLDVLSPQKFVGKMSWNVIGRFVIPIAVVLPMSCSQDEKCSEVTMDKIERSEGQAWYEKCHVDFVDWELLGSHTRQDGFFLADPTDTHSWAAQCSRKY